MNTNDDLAEMESTVAKQLSRHWWLLALRGVVAILFGAVAFLWPAITLLTLVYLFGAFAIANGILSFVVAFSAPKGSRIWSLVAGGLLGMIAGLIAFLMPGITALSLVILVAVWAIATGGMEIAAAIRLRKEINHEWLLVTAGIFSIIFGLIVFFLPIAGALVLVWWIGAYAIAFGALLIVLAFRLRHWAHLIAASPHLS
jgi:uncharacterized membrane protein HdeD (DUF308 family)